MVEATYRVTTSLAAGLTVFLVLIGAAWCGTGMRSWDVRWERLWLAIEESGGRGAGRVKGVGWRLVRISPGMVRAMAAFLSAGVVVGMAAKSILAAAAWVAGGVALAGVYLSRQGRVRSGAMEDEFEQALLIIVSGMKAGLSLIQGLETAVREGREPIASELGRVVKEYQAGVPLARALASFAGRCRSPEVGFFVEALDIYRQCGGNLTEILENLAGTIRDRRLMRGELRARMAETHMAVNFLATAPVALAAGLWLLQPDMLRPLFAEPLGRLGLGYASVSWVVGIGVIRHLVHIPELN